MSKLIWIAVTIWIARSVWQAVKKAIAQAQAEIAAQKAREQGEQQAQPPPRPIPQGVRPGEDPKAALLRMLAAAGVSPSVTKVVESTLDYDDDARENATDYDDASGEDGTDYDDASAEDATDYDDMPIPKTVVYPMPAPPVVYDLPAAPVVYAMPDDRTSNAYNIEVRKEIASHAQRPIPGRPPVHGLDNQSLRSRELVRDGVIMDVLLTRYRNPFLKHR